MIAAAVIGVRLEIVRIASPAAALLLLALFAGAAGQFAVSLVNWLCTLLVPPRPMMRLDFSVGIPAEHRTLVAVPALLTSERTVRDLVEQLELRYLANQDDNLWFALLSDFPDADQETLAGDLRLLELARTEIERLNERYCADRPVGGIFYLLHRPRKWNRQQGAWMGEERKRGKLAALNRLVQTGEADAFSATIGDLPLLRSVRYVITLDSDTQLPRDAGRELVGCAAHPLNQARNRSAFGRGGGGLRRASAASNRHHARAHRSRFSRLTAGDAGIDPYTLQTSDLYHDLFGQGSFIGKGIYDVAAFESACAGRFPENRLLSHDLIEGCFARSGLVNDVELFEGVPSRLLVDMNRRHRWIRGDWQIASWLGDRVPTLRGKGGQSTLRAVAVENPRQLAAEPHAGAVAGLSGVGLAAGPGFGRHLYTVGPGAHLWSGQHCGAARIISSAGRQALDAARPATTCGSTCGPGWRRPSAGAFCLTRYTATSMPSSARCIV